MLTAVDHVVLAVRDLDAASAGYERLLGVAPSWRGDRSDGGTASAIFRLDNTYAELISPAGDGVVSSVLRARLEEHGDGLVGLGFATDDLEACCRVLAERGLEPGPIEPRSARERAGDAVRKWRRAVLPEHRTRGLLLFPVQHDPESPALRRTEALGDTEASVHALDHAVVQTSDGDAAAALFGNALGLRLALDRKFPDWGVRLMFFRVGGVTVEVAAVLDGADAARALPGASGRGSGDRLYGLSYRVGNADAARERLARTGIDVSEVRSGRRPGTRVFSVRSGTLGVPTLMLEVEAASR